MRQGGSYAFAGELEADNPDAVWLETERRPDGLVRPMRPADIVYVGDIYYELDGDGGWKVVAPGRLTKGLYRLVAR